MRTTGVTARGIISPIFQKGDNLAKSVCECVQAAAETEGFPISDGDIIGVTESVLARTQGNYATCGQIAEDVKNKFGGGDMGIVFPIMSRNRFAIILKAIAMGCERLYVQLSYPADEVGNALISLDTMDEKDVNPYRDSFDETSFRKMFGKETVHPFTGVDYIDYYKSFAPHIEVVFSNDPAHILKYTKNVLCCDIHTRKRTKAILQKNGAEKVFSLDEILATSVNGSGFNPEFGLLGSNMATPDSVKLFPRESWEFVQAVQDGMLEKTGKAVEVLVYGDGCFKDPVGGIWELADPVVSPAFTKRLAGTPNELKMKYFADNDFGNLDGEELKEAMRDSIRKKGNDLVGTNAALGTTPRRYTDLVGSLCDLVSGSGDRGTPVVYIKGYFDNYATE